MSRDSIFKDQQGSGLDADESNMILDRPFHLPSMEFEFVEVDVEANHRESDGNVEQEAEEFEFPLFASSTGGPNSTGNLDLKLMTVNLVPEIIEEIPIERESLHYFATYLMAERAQFEAAAINFAEIQESTPIDAYPWRILDVTAHNLRISREKRVDRKRSGKRSRMEKIASRERKTARSKVLKQLWIQERRLLKKAKPRKHRAFGDEYTGTHTSLS